MGKRGPAPTPTAILRARGSWRAGINKREPKVLPGRPNCPSWLPKEAKKAWKWLVPVLESMNVLTQVDRDSLCRYCVTWSRWKASETFLDEHGDTYPVKAFDRVKKEYVTVGFKNYPQVRVADRLASQLGKLEQSFGLTPSARSRIETTPGSDGKEADQEAGKIKFFHGGARAGA